MKKEVIILDTNIWISYLLSKKFDSLVKIILENKLEIATCKHLITEFKDVLQRKKLKKYIGKTDIEEAVRIHLKICKFTKIDLRENQLTDKNDNYLLDLFKEANASTLVTGDKQLIAEASKLGFNVITLAKFEKLME